MKREDIMRLGELARITINDQEADELLEEIPAVLSYVSAITDIAEDAEVSKRTGVVANVMREDEVTVPPGTNTETLLTAAPERSGEFLEVKKILNHE